MPLGGVYRPQELEWDALVQERKREWDALVQERERLRRMSAASGNSNPSTGPSSPLPQSGARDVAISDDIEEPPELLYDPGQPDIWDTTGVTEFVQERKGQLEYNPDTDRIIQRFKDRYETLVYSNTRARYDRWRSTLALTSGILICPTRTETTTTTHYPTAPPFSTTTGILICPTRTETTQLPTSP